MSIIDLVSRIIFPFFFCRVINVLSLNLDVHLVQTRMGVVMVGPMNVFKRLTRTLKVAGLYYFAYLENKHTDSTFELISCLSTFF